MLAATKALKPSPPHPRASASPKVAQAVHAKVFSKVSNVWERINSKPSTPLERVRSKLRKQPWQDQANHPVLVETKSPSFAFDHEERAPTRSETRLSQRNKLAKGKAQAAPGGIAARESIALPVPLLQADQLANVSRRPQEQGFFQRQRVSEIEAPGDDAIEALSHDLQDPFRTEAGFELNLEDRILSTAPIGSSTPRAQSNVGSMASSTEDSANNASSEAQLKLARVVFQLGQDGAARGQARQVMLRPSESRKTVAEAEPVAPQLYRPRSRVSHIRGIERVKKHPSPSKRDLEELELALQRYGPFGESEPEVDIDEPSGPKQWL